MPAGASEDGELDKIQIVTQYNHTKLEKSIVLSPKSKKSQPAVNARSQEAPLSLSIDETDDFYLDNGDGSNDPNYDDNKWTEEVSEPDSMFYRQMLTEHAQENNIEGVIDILEKAKSIPNIYNHVDESSYSVLHHAAFRGNTKICKILVNHGADVCATDKFGKTPVHFAIQFGFDVSTIK